MCDVLPKRRHSVLWQPGQQGRGSLRVREQQEPGPLTVDSHTPECTPGCGRAPQRGRTGAWDSLALKSNSLILKDPTQP